MAKHKITCDIKFRYFNEHIYIYDQVSMFDQFCRNKSKYFQFISILVFADFYLEIIIIEIIYLYCIWQLSPTYFKNIPLILYI